jgi:hypothetical protein
MYNTHKIIWRKRFINENNKTAHTTECKTKLLVKGHAHMPLKELYRLKKICKIKDLRINE